MLWIILLLDLRQRGILVAIEGMLPVRLVGVRFIEIRSTPGRDFLQLWNECIRN